jgi:hypothetical protein
VYQVENGKGAMPAWDGRLSEWPRGWAGRAVGGGGARRRGRRPRLQWRSAGGLGPARPNHPHPLKTLSPISPRSAAPVPLGPHPPGEEEIQAVAAYVYDQASGNKW